MPSQLFVRVYSDTNVAKFFIFCEKMLPGIRICLRNEGEQPWRDKFLSPSLYVSLLLGVQKCDEK